MFSRTSALAAAMLALNLVSIAQARADSAVLTCDTSRNSPLVETHIEIFNVGSDDLLVVEDMRDGERVSTRISGRQWLVQGNVRLETYGPGLRNRNLVRNSCGEVVNGKCLETWAIAETDDVDLPATSYPIACKSASKTQPVRTSSTQPNSQFPVSPAKIAELKAQALEQVTSEDSTVKVQYELGWECSAQGTQMRCVFSDALVNWNDWFPVMTTTASYLLGGSDPKLLSLTHEIR